MTQAQMDEQLWKALFREQHEALTEVAEMILFRNDSPEQILQAALAELQGQPFCETFARASALRAVVKATIAYDYSHFDLTTALAASAPGGGEQLRPLPLKVLPWAERATYFLREVLRFSRRDSALLLGISDSAVEQFDCLARSRMKVPVGHQIDSSSPSLNSSRRGSSWY
jgi:hypothetical protein